MPDFFELYEVKPGGDHIDEFRRNAAAYAETVGPREPEA